MKMAEKQMNKITTPDLYFAAYLKAKNCHIVGVQKEGSKTIFTFDVDDSGLTVQELKFGYFNNDDDEKFSVIAILFADAIRSLKTLCHVEDHDEKLITPDLYFAAYLKTKKCTPETVRQRDTKTVFVFNVTNSGLSILELKLGYFNSIQDHRCTINASDYTDAVRSLKTMCHITTDT